MTPRLIQFVVVAMVGLAAPPAARAQAGAPEAGEGAIPAFADLLRHPVKLRPELEGKHPRVFVTEVGLEALRRRSQSTHKDDWARATRRLVALEGAPPPPPGPQSRRSQNVVAFAIVQAALTYKVGGDKRLLEAARRWLMAAIDYEPWGYANNKPNVDLAAGHLLYAVGWAYDLLFHDLSAEERVQVRTSLARHAQILAEHFSPDAKGKKRFVFTQNHDFIPTAGLAVAALALLGEVPEAARWAALARAHHHRAGQLLSPDGHFYEGFEYWIFSAPWLVHFLDAWEHATGESLWDRPFIRNWKLYVAHTLLPDGQKVFDFGDIWEGPKTRAGIGPDYARAYPEGRLESNYNVLFRVAARLKDPETQAVAERLKGFGHSCQQDWWTLLWRDPDLKAAPIARLPLTHHFADQGVVFWRSSWEADATAFAFKAGPPEGHRVARLLARVPEWRLDSGHAHPDAGSFIVWAGGRYLVGDTGYEGKPSARNHNTVVVGGVGQGVEGKHDVWRSMPYTPEGLGKIRITQATLGPRSVRVTADLAAAYPPEAGLKRLLRTFTFDAPGTFGVRDEVELDGPRKVEWLLHADDPLIVEGRRFSLSGSGSAKARLVGTVRGPAGADVRTAQTRVWAPGPPGSIEQGQLEPRGHELVISSTPAARATFDVTFDVGAAKRARRQGPRVNTALERRRAASP